MIHRYRPSIARVCAPSCSEPCLRAAIPANRPCLVTQGSRFGGYPVIALIGAGGMGEVYRARDTKLARDVAIKEPANVKMTRDGVVKVLDFGLAKMVPEASPATSTVTAPFTGTHVILGPPAYMAPEQAQG